MARKKDDKRVLRVGNGRQQSKSKRKKIRKRNNYLRNSRNQSHYPPHANYNGNRNQKKRSGKLVLVMIVILVAFVAGAGIGISLSLHNEDSVDEGPHFENVTAEMTTDLNDTGVVYYEKSVDGVDYNQNQTSQVEIVNYGNYR